MTGGGSKQQQQQKGEGVVPPRLRVWEMLDANDSARRAYKRVLARPTLLELAKNLMCLLLWLESAMGVKGVLQQVSAMETSGDPRLSLLIKEADGLYGYLLDGHDDALPEPLVSNIPTIVSICGGGGSGSRLLDFRFFKFHKDLVARGVAVIRDTVAALVFNDDLHAMLRRFEDDVDSSSSVNASTPRPAPPAPAPAPELMEFFVPVSRTPPEDSRTAFLAFTEIKSKAGKPHGITAQDIIQHFQGVFGFAHDIERVEIEQPCAGLEESKHGIIVFTSREHMKKAMFGETSAFFRIKYNDIWLQCYMPPF